MMIGTCRDVYILGGCGVVCVLPGDIGVIKKLASGMLTGGMGSAIGVHKRPCSSFLCFVFMFFFLITTIDQ